MKDFFQRANRVSRIYQTRRLITANPQTKTSNFSTQPPTEYAWAAAIPSPSPEILKPCSTQVFDADILGIPKKDQDFFKAANTCAQRYMSRDIYDISHDYEHIQRVVQNANDIYTSELEANPEPAKKLDPLLIFVGCLMHDVGDHKYHSAEEAKHMVGKELISCGASPELAQKIQTIVRNVSFSNEMKQPKAVQAALTVYPELAIVQDADRLDALGPIGQARCFAHHGACTKWRGSTIHLCVHHHWEKLHLLPGMMKTKYGRKEGQKRWEWLCRFREEWYASTDASRVVKKDDEARDC